MQLLKFYELLQAEIDAILAATENANDARLHQHKDPKNNRGYALLVWFLAFYEQTAAYRTYITEGSDDYSCDIIFHKTDARGKTVYYVVQSKNIHPQNPEKNYPAIDKEELNAAVAEFRQLLDGLPLLSKNERFSEKYKELLQHLKNNGEAKFIFFSPAKPNRDIDTAQIVQNFEQAYRGVRLEIIDGERLREAYIERRYKGILSNSPLLQNDDAQSSVIVLPIERRAAAQRDVLEFEGRAKAVIVLLRPKTLYDLFSVYAFSLFRSNVRNPLESSNYNQKIVDTLLHNADEFWFFNNGITAITDRLPQVNALGAQLELDGFQIINGAQTVYSVYAAYAKANDKQRNNMDAYARISCRLIGSANERFNLQITRYTNSQNPMYEMDFWANDAVQQRLQRASFETDTWYATRRGEFQLTKAQQQKLGISILRSGDIAGAYLAFHLQRPYDVSNSKRFFISEKEQADGLYETIFHEEIRFEDIRTANIVAKLQGKLSVGGVWGIDYHLKTIFILGLSKLALQAYYQQKYRSEEIQLNRFILESERVEKREKEIRQVLEWLHAWVDTQEDMQHLEGRADLMRSRVFYQQKVELLRGYIGAGGMNIL